MEQEKTTEDVTPAKTGVWQIPAGAMLERCRMPACTGMTVVMLLVLFLSGAAIAQISADFFLGGAVRIGTGTPSCTAGSNTGALHYNAATDIMEVCNGTAWVGAVAGGPAGANMYVQVNGNTDSEFLFDYSVVRRVVLGNPVYASGATRDISWHGVGANSARTIGLERATAGAGKNLTFNGGGAFSGDLNAVGGDMELNTGQSTGTATSQIIFNVPNVGLSGGTDNALVERMRVNGEGTRVTGLAIGTDSPLTVSGAGTRMLFYTRKAAFRAGYVNGAQWDDGNIGNYSTAFGEGNIASGQASMVWGQNNTASNTNATAWGNFNTASGAQATVWGFNSIASGTNATVWGSGTGIDRANCLNCTAFGNATRAITNANATAWGDGTIANGAQSTAWGFGTAASGTNATAWGFGTTASGAQATAWGNATNANGTNSTAWGYFTTAAGNTSTAFGYEATVTAAGTRSATIGLGDASTASYPQVSGVESMGIFMQDQQGLTFSATHVMGLFGGNLVLDDDGPATQLSARAALDLGSGVGGIIVPNGADNQRPAGVGGMIRFCNANPLLACTLNKFEVYEAGVWKLMGTSVSDRRAKKDIEALNGAEMLDKLAKVETYSFHIKTDKRNRLHYGVIAQQLETVFPGMVVSPKNPKEMKSVFHKDLIGPLIAAVKELKARNDAAKTELASLNLARSSAAGPPPASECTGDSQRGRLRSSAADNRLYVCSGAAGGWSYVSFVN